MTALVFRVFLLTVALTFSAADTQYGFFGWKENGCSTTEPDDSSYNSIQLTSPSQWWTVSFTDKTQPLGGMINFVRLAGGLGSAIQVALTNGINGQRVLADTSQVHGLGFNTTINNDSFCIGDQTSKEYGCFSQTPEKTIVIRGSGTGDDGTFFDYNLELVCMLHDKWCLLDNARKTIGIKWPQKVSWFHYCPAATVQGTIGFNGTELSITGTGQQDHVYGDFIPGVTLFKHWTDAHFYNDDTGFNMYWGSMQDRWAFARIETSSAPQGLMFEKSEIQSKRVYTTASPDRPVSYAATGKSASTGASFSITYEVLVPGLTFPKGSYVEDIVKMSGTVCTSSDSSSCEAVTARGWAQIRGAPW